MTNAELNLFIATTIEPKSEFHFGAARSKGNAWFRSDGRIQPRDFCSDPACILMLIRECAKRSGFTVCISVEPGGFTGVDGLGEPCVYGPEIGRVVADAFYALVNGVSAAVEE